MDGNFTRNVQNFNQFMQMKTKNLVTSYCMAVRNNDPTIETIQKSKHGRRKNHTCNKTTQKYIRVVRGKPLS